MTHVPYPGCYCADCVEGTPPTQETNHMTTVSQEAREAAADYQDHARGYVCSAPLRDGRADHASIVQAFAKFEQSIRQSAERAFEERERKLREQLARYEGGAGPDDWRECPGQCGESCCGYHDACRQALKETPDAG